jgi:hypothetical protein
MTGGVSSTSSNPHLNVFEPYRDLGGGHEDQLTRAAMIVLRLVPLAREALLHAIGEPSQSVLPDCTIDLQAAHLVEASEEGAANGLVERGRLVSVFLTPDFEPPEIEEEVTDTDRGQRFDGILRFDPELVVLLESKVCRKWAKRNGHRVSELNLGGVRFAQRRTCLLRWHDLLEAWWRLAEIGVLSPAEQALVQDMLGYAHTEFGQLLPFGSLRRIGKDPIRRKWWLRSLLREASGLEPERIGLVHVRLDTALGAQSLQRAVLEFDEDDRLTLHAWPGELKPQARHLYLTDHAKRLCELPTDSAAAAGAHGGEWRVEPQPILGFRNAPSRTRVYLTSRLDARTYAQRWGGEDWSQVGAHSRERVESELWPWLLSRGYASKQDTARLEPFLRTLGRRAAHLRPSMHVACAWSWEQAKTLEEQGKLIDAVHSALNSLLAALQEPPLQQDPPAPADREQHPETVDAADRHRSARHGKPQPAARPAAPPQDDRRSRPKPRRQARARRSKARG